MDRNKAKYAKIGEFWYRFTNLNEDFIKIERRDYTGLTYYQKFSAKRVTEWK